MADEPNTGKFAEPALVVGGVRHKPHKEHAAADHSDAGVPQSRVVAGLEPVAQVVLENPGAAKAVPVLHHTPHTDKPHAGKDKPAKQAHYNIQQPR